MTECMFQGWGRVGKGGGLVCVCVFYDQSVCFDCTRMYAAAFQQIPTFKPW